ncbi:MAG TPA: GT-D fold domain-containing glycosyltransferase [Saprospiraceae bacterium]|nr:GT-D fold domain-containing glycosyltransferase [Saprospiraceae bacterium]
MSYWLNIHYSPLFKIPRKIAKYGFSALYPLVIKIWELPQVKSIEETILALSKNRLCIARFGDSEMLYIAKGLNLPYQRFDKRLADELSEILLSKDDHILVGLPDAYRTLEDFKPNIKIFWRSQITYNYPTIYKLLDLTKQYYNANITRLYYGYKDVQKSSYHFSLMRSLWEERNVLLIEGEKSRLGMGNDLFADAISVERILGPAHHAYDQIDNLYREVLKHVTEKLVLVAMGPTAKALVYRLAQQGYQAIDIGNLDLEYEWFKRGVKERVIIPGKYVSEVKGGRNVEDATDEVYLSQIVAKCL